MQLALRCSAVPLGAGLYWPQSSCLVLVRSGVELQKGQTVSLFEATRRTGSVDGDGQPAVSAPEHDNAYNDFGQGLEGAAE